MVRTNDTNGLLLFMLFLQEQKCCLGSLFITNVMCAGLLGCVCGLEGTKHPTLPTTNYSKYCFLLAQFACKEIQQYLYQQGVIVPGGDWQISLQAGSWSGNAESESSLEELYPVIMR